jgi:hypothetical protein
VPPSRVALTSSATEETVAAAPPGCGPQMVTVTGAPLAEVNVSLRSKGEPPSLIGALLCFEHARQQKRTATRPSRGVRFFEPLLELPIDLPSHGAAPSRISPTSMRVVVDTCAFEAL